MDKRDIQPQDGARPECLREELHSKGHVIMRCVTCGTRVYDWDEHIMAQKLSWLASKFTVRT